jgi:hypothetical protein
MHSAGLWPELLSASGTHDNNNNNNNNTVEQACCAVKRKGTC